MKLEINRGKFIVFEGLDGSGKTTQLKRLAAHFAKQAQGVSFLATKEPTDGTLGNLARHVLLGDTPLSTDAFALLFAADRVEHIIREVQPALEAGTFVLCDRFVYSNMAFQGTALPQEVIASYNERAVSLATPDLTIFIDVSPEECTRRIVSTRKNLEIYDGMEFAREIRNLYMKAFECYGERMPVKIVDGNMSEDEVFEQLLAIVSPLMQ